MVVVAGGVADDEGVAVGVSATWPTRGEMDCMSGGVVPRCRVFFRGFACGGDKMLVGLSRSDEVMLNSDFGESKFGKTGGGASCSSSDEPIVHPLGGTVTCGSPSCANSLGKFFLGTVSGEEVTGTLAWSTFSEFTRRGLGTGRSAFSGGLEEEGESEEEVGGAMGEGMRGAGCWVQEGRRGSEIRKGELSVDTHVSIPLTKLPW